MPIFEFAKDEIRQIKRITFSEAQLHERRDLQRLLRANVAVVAPDTLVIAEEFGDWDESRRRIDLLGIDQNANLVVIELKRTEDGGHMELQAIRYAAMVSTMTFDQAVDVFTGYLTQIGKSGADARAQLLDHLGWDEPDEELFAQDVRIILASAEFSRELTTAVLWLIERGIDIRCVRLQPYFMENRVLVDVQQIIPLPEVVEYQVRVTAKKRKEREARTDMRDMTTYDVRLGDRDLPSMRKRHAIYKVFRHLVENGVSPEEVGDRCGSWVKRAVVSVDGVVSASEFCRLVQEAWAREGRNFVSNRFYTEDDEVMYFGDRTYAFSRKWGGPEWERAIESLRDKFPEHGITFSPSEQC